MRGADEHQNGGPGHLGLSVPDRCFEHPETTAVALPACRDPKRLHRHWSKHVDGHSRHPERIVGSEVAFDRPRHESRDEPATHHVLGPGARSTSRGDQQVAFDDEAGFHGGAAYGDARCRPADEPLRGQPRRPSRMRSTPGGLAVDFGKGGLAVTTQSQSSQPAPTRVIAADRFGWDRVSIATPWTVSGLAPAQRSDRTLFTTLRRARLVRGCDRQERGAERGNGVDGSDATCGRTRPSIAAATGALEADQTEPPADRGPPVG